MLSVSRQHLERLTEAFYLLLRGRLPGQLEVPEGHADDELGQVYDYANRFIAEYGHLAEALAALSRGNLDVQTPRSQLRASQDLKNLQANLRHLTWKTQQIAGGDLTQTVDFMGDFSVAFNQMTQQLHEAFDQIERQNQALSEANEVIRLEKEKADRLLLNILPARVAEDLKESGTTRPQSFAAVTVLFSDIVGFTSHSARLDPVVLIDELNDLFTAFDHIIEANRAERIKTIGDAYLAVCGMPAADDDHAANMVRSAQGMVAYVRERNKLAEHAWELRVGLHSGPLVGGVVGVKKYIYDVFGDTINTASRMESHCEPMHINISQSTRDLLGDRFELEERDTALVKGKGPMRMYYVHGAP